MDLHCLINAVKMKRMELTSGVNRGGGIQARDEESGALAAQIDGHATEIRKLQLPGGVVIGRGVESELADARSVLRNVIQPRATSCARRALEVRQEALTSLRLRAHAILVVGVAVVGRNRGRVGQSASYRLHPWRRCRPLCHHAYYYTHNYQQPPNDRHSHSTPARPKLPADLAREHLLIRECQNSRL